MIRISVVEGVTGLHVIGAADPAWPLALGIPINCWRSKFQTSPCRGLILEALGAGAHVAFEKFFGISLANGETFIDRSEPCDR